MYDDLPHPQDASPSEPTTLVDEETEPTPQGRAGDPEDVSATEPARTDETAPDADPS